MDTSSKTANHNSEHAVAGAVSGFVTRCMCQPLDVVKIRFQLQVEPISKYHVSKYHSIAQAFYLIIKEEGIFALWKGHVPAQLLSVVYGMSQVNIYDMKFSSFNNFSLLNEWKYSTQFVAGSGAGFLATITSFPFDTIRTRLVAQSILFYSIKYFFSCIIRHESPKVFFYGLLPTLLQIVPHTGLQFAFYGCFSDIYKKYYNESNISFYNSMISGSAAGLLAKTAVYPLDLSRKRLQIQGFKHGRQGFGLIPSQLKATAATALHFTVYEQSLVLLKALRSDISEK
ncbi:Mitochondrial thiamine pyrophosphate carrier [Habropoda laboriosa]|uniref:Mitochondrial thiamine pyrophosphate carrier n=1 Tax=Habropoda laboriosa TaxID=597456 RepID=A0A0L7QNJ6_9HYME|nr:Mitochondrial thiamine pyrophosphate carrier [Habropoda laboriosa]